MTATTDLDLLLKAVLAHPEEDTPRLMYADALEERGEEGDAGRAEFIRVQCAGRRYPLRKHHVDRWFAVFPWDYVIRRGSYIRYCGPAPHSVSIRRGFVERVTCPAADWLAHADTLLAAHPVTTVRLTTYLAEQQTSTYPAEQQTPTYPAWRIPKEWTGDWNIVILAPLGFDLHARPDRHVEEVLKKRWPRIIFTLPG